MISITIFLESIAERKLIGQSLDTYNSFGLKELIRYTFCNRKNLEIEAARESTDLWIVSLNDEEDLRDLKRIRRWNPQVELMVISDRTFDFSRCVTPEIRPIMLCKRPLDKEILRCEITSVIRYLYLKQERVNTNESFFFAVRKMRKRIPFTRIRYFEARNKKIVLYGTHGDYEFYDSFTRMGTVLGDQFVRCHRSYIVNISYIAGMDYGGQYLELCDGTQIPISKKYRRETEASFGLKKSAREDGN
ncbi:MAG: LytTR family DNA-binding domain-containing protein [Eubacteriales bacterium]|nr:LytTR family DNA-binding domain-containing protein [Eubacteriales bacterium]